VSSGSITAEASRSSRTPENEMKSPKQSVQHAGALRVPLAAIACSFAALCIYGQSLPNEFPFPNASGVVATYNAANQPIDLSGPFFQVLGTNGRSCFSCHRPAQGWSISADEVKARFETTRGLDPIFRTNDGSNCDHDVDTSTLSGRRRAFSLLIGRGLIRIAMQVPADAEFNVVSVLNPYGCGDAATLSVYRRPLPSTNLRFLSAVMWDGRESSTQTATERITPATNPGDLLADLAHQSLDATEGHAQGTTPLTANQQDAIVRFEMSLATAQIYDYRAGALNMDGAAGGPSAIGTQTLPAFFVGMNDPLGGNPRGTPFTPLVFRLFDAWMPANSPYREDEQGRDGRQARRASIARGEALFNSKPIRIEGVAGLNDDLNIASTTGTCGTCHDSPNIGNHSLPVALNIGVGDVGGPLDLAYLPVITVQNKVTGETRVTTDPGRALITGQWKDVGKMKGPILRGLASRAPYFHNGSAASLDDVVHFYDERFHIGLTAQDKKDLVAFLKAL
jgi:cytochrome c peroxidase